MRQLIQTQKQILIIEVFLTMISTFFFMGGGGILLDTSLPWPNSQSLSGGEKLTLTYIYGCRTGPPGYVGWRTTRYGHTCQSQLYPPSQGLRIGPLMSSHTRVSTQSAYLQINRTKINGLNINVLQINGSLHQQKFVEVQNKMPSKNALQINGSLHQPLLI